MSNARDLDAVREKVKEAWRARKTLLYRAWILTEANELTLEAISEEFLQRLNRLDLFGPVSAAIRELVQNATKANFKRILFREQGINADDPSSYDQGMRAFRKVILGNELKDMLPEIIRAGARIHVRFTSSVKALSVVVQNDFPLYRLEEERIRDRFVQAQRFDNLFEFHEACSDVVEGAGMGIAMIRILLHQAGLDSRAFSIGSDVAGQRTKARIIIPVAADYESPRKLFERERARRGIAVEEMRDLVRSGVVRLPAITG